MKASLRPAPALVRLVAAMAVLGSHVLPLGAQEEPDPVRWGADVALSLTSSGGNEQLTVLTTEVGITRLDSADYELGFTGRFRYGRSEGEDVAQNLRGALSFDFRPAARWSPFLFATGEQDPFRKLDLRVTGGAGIKHTFWSSGWDEVSLSSAVLYSYEDLAVADSLGSGISREALLSWRARGRRELSEGSRIEQTVFYQPAWDDPDDYRLESRTSGRVALSQRLAFTATALYERDNTPAPEVEPDDWSLAVGLSLSTQW